MSKNLRVVQGSCATLSWIDPVTELKEVDDGPPDEALGIDGITKVDNCRFSHLLTASIVVEDGRITRGYFDRQSGLHARLSYKDTESQHYPVRRDMTSRTTEQAVFIQTVGCRTNAPGIIGGWAGGALAVQQGYPYELGSTVGSEVAKRLKSFPPIWTTLQLIIHADGRWDAKLLRSSIFPSLSFYKGVPKNQAREGQISAWKRQYEYDGVPHYARWLEVGWGAGNPWRENGP